MHTTPSNIPTASPGDSIKARTLDHVAEITKAACNYGHGAGMHSYSTNSQTNVGLNVNLTKPPIWAMVTGARRKYAAGKYPSLEDPDCPPVAGQFDYCFPPYNPVGCANYYYAHSWSELVEDYDISRHGSEIFPVKIDKTLPEYVFPPNNVNGALEKYKRSCRDIAKEYADSYGLYGHIHDTPLYEANNQPLPIGYVTLIYFGNGPYMVTTAKDVSAGYFFNVYHEKTGGIFTNSNSCCGGVDFVPQTVLSSQQKQEAYSNYLNWKFKEPGKVNLRTESLWEN